MRLEFTDLARPINEHEPPDRAEERAAKGIGGKLPFNDSADLTDIKHLILSQKARWYAAYVASVAASSIANR